MTIAGILDDLARRRHAGERGQSMVEAAIFLPIMLLMLFGVIFFDRLGLVSERSESAVRYGDMVAFRQGQAYSMSVVSDVVQEALYHNTPDQLLDLCLAPGAAANPSSSNVNNAMRAALVQAQVAPGSTGPNAAPSAKPFWRPDSVTTPNCAPGALNLSSSSPTGVGNLPMSVNTFHITAGVNVPSYLQPIFAMSGPSNQTDTGANMAFVNVAAPSTLIACVPGLSVLLTVINPAATGTIPCQ